MRRHVAHDAARALPKKLVFKIDYLKVDGGSAGFEGYALFEDGSPAIPDFMPDVVYCTVLQKEGEEWKVIADFTRTDVPSAEEIREIKKKIPKDFPSQVLPVFWRRLLGL